MSHDVFISYSRKDLSFVRSFVKRIENEVHTVPWVDLKGIETGVQFEDVIVEAIDNCELVLFLFSKNSLGSPWTKKEVMYAKNVGKKIYPVVIDRSQLSGWFLFEYGDVNYIDYSRDEQVEKLFGDIRDYLNRTTEYVCDDSREGPKGSLDRAVQRILAEDDKMDAAEMFRMFAKAKRERNLIAKLPDEIKMRFADVIRAIEDDFAAAEEAKTCSVDSAVALVAMATQKATELWTKIDNMRHPGEEMTITLPGGVTMVFCWCPATTSEAWKKISGGIDYFLMGSPEAEEDRDDREVLHRVMLTKGFWIGKYEVTQAQWESVMKENPSEFRGPDRPVESVSWEACQKFIRTINADGQVTVSLPTEAQWEYACRAGTTTPYNFGSSLNGDKANCDGRYPYGTVVKGLHRDGTMPVGSFVPNAWGLYDMHGNVKEWCQDRYDEYYYEKSPMKDPMGGNSGSLRVSRGGGWFNLAQDCRSANRGKNESVYSKNRLGLRLVCSMESRS